MRELRISLINYEWSKVYPISSFAVVNIGHVKDMLAADNKIFRNQNLVLLYKGNSIPSDDILLINVLGETAEVNDEVIEIHVGFLGIAESWQLHSNSNQYSQQQSQDAHSLQLTYSIDPLSISAAKEYVAEHEPDNQFEFEFESRACGCNDFSCSASHSRNCSNNMSTNSQARYCTSRIAGSSALKRFVNSLPGKDWCVHVLMNE